MQDRVRGINRVTEDSDNNRDNNKNRLASLVASTDLDRCGKFIDKVREERNNRIKARQVRKFHILLCKNIQINDKSNIANRSRQGVNASRQGHSSNRLDNGNQADNNYKNKWVINLSKTNLTEAQKAVLANGPNYFITPNHIPNVEYITVVESMCPKLKEDDAMELRLDMNSLLRKAKTPKPNLTKQERIGLFQLKKDKDRLILTADKGVAMVVMDKEDYTNKAQELLSKPAYKEIPRDPTNKIMAQVITKLRKIKKDTNLGEGTYKAMYSTGCVLPKFYGLPKIHKTGNPLRPIVSSRGWLLMGCPKSLARYLNL